MCVSKRAINFAHMQDDLCGKFESCAKCWPNNCSSGDCSPKGLDELSESYIPPLDTCHYYIGVS